MKTPQYLLHATPKSNVPQIKEQWLRYQNGRATVTSDLCYAHEFAKKRVPAIHGELWKVLIMKPPTDKIVGKGRTVKLKIDEEHKTIDGVHLWDRERMKLWIYDTKEVYEILTHGHPVSDLISHNQRGAIAFENKYVKLDIIATINPNEEIHNYLWEIEDKMSTFQSIDVEKYINNIYEKIEKAEWNELSKNFTIDSVREILITTIEAEAVNIVRELALIIKEIKWYTLSVHGDKQSLIWDSRWRTFMNPLILERIRDKEFNGIFNSSDEPRLWAVDRYMKIHVSKFYEELQQQFALSPENDLSSYEMLLKHRSDVLDLLAIGDTKKLFEVLRKIPYFQQHLDWDTGIDSAKNKILRQHTKRVMDIFYANYDDFSSPLMDKQTMWIILLLHDIGKSYANEVLGDHKFQHFVSALMIPSIMQALWCDTEQIRVALSLIDSPLIKGKDMMKRIIKEETWTNTRRRAVEAITQKAGNTISPQEYFRLLQIFTLADGGAYGAFQDSFSKDEDDKLVWRKDIQAKFDRIMKELPN